tara:strand:+ start:13201 stop:14259 length:1059 start_codon:yes stop_codon:yes gene_type:complete
MIDIDFSLAINNRTGKYYLGLDIIKEVEARIDKIHYGQFSSISNNDFFRRVQGRFYHWETLSRLGRFKNTLPLRKSLNPVVHLDPLTILNWELKESDVVVCHDIGPITHPDYFSKNVDVLYRKVYEKISRTGCNMVFVSEATKEEFIRHYGTRFSSLKVAYIPIREGLLSHGDMNQVEESEKYFITVGAIGDRKNQAAVIHAFARSGLAAQGYRYYIVGGDEPGAQEVHKLVDVTEGVEMLGYVDDERLVNLYKRSAGFILMSKLEGFGMPVAEALYFGTPCLVTENSVLEEVGGKAVFTAPNDNINKISSTMIDMAGLSQRMKMSLYQESKMHLLKFSPKTVMKQWNSVLE